MQRAIGLVISILALSCWGGAPRAHAGTTPLLRAEQRLALDDDAVTVQRPQGYRLELLTSRLQEPRLMTFGPGGELFIGSKSGAVYRLPPPYTEPQVLMRLSGYPHAVALRKDEILIARTGGLYRAPYQPGQTRVDPEAVRLLAPLPGGGGHSSRTVAVGPDGRVYLGLGIQGNCSDQYLGEGYPSGERRGGILVLREEGGEPRWETYGAGLRNPVGFAWQPETGVLFASNNGPDHWGFDQPPEYFSRIAPGSFHGMPWFQYDGRTLRRDDCILRPPPRPQAEVTVPEAVFPARSAPMAVAFVPAGAPDRDLAGDAIVALHGSWATRPSGGFWGDPASRRHPKLVVVRFEDGEARRVDDLVTGFQQEDGSRWARPVGLAVAPDGAIYFTSDSGTEGLFRLRPAVAE
ncbi:MAG: sugar dehydrogenase [Thermodesulfobacteriota bacterium]